MDIKTLYTIYKMEQKGMKVTKKSLNKIGITDSSLKNLLQEELIYETEHKIYRLTSIKRLYQYGMNCLKQYKQDEAQQIFELCYFIKPNHRDTCLQLFYNAISTKQFELAYKYLHSLENVSTNEHLRKDYKIYLYLLSNICNAPEEYKEKVENIINDNNLLLHKKPDHQQKQENLIMELILQGKFKYAYETLNDFIEEERSHTIHRKIIKSLLKSIISLNETQKVDLLQQIKEREYRKIIEDLEQLSLQRKLKSNEQSVLMIAKSIINIFETGIVPVPIENDTDQVSIAIACHDYDKALELEYNFLESKNLPQEKSHIYQLLLQITIMIYNMNRKESRGIALTYPLKPML